MFHVEHIGAKGLFGEIYLYFEMEKIEGNIIDIHQRRIYPGCILIDNGIILSLEENTNHYENYISPGLIDAHVHIESSMLTPENFSHLVIQKGTVAVVTDPHEIANVLGMEGIDYMIKNSEKAAIKIFFTIPSCVPATRFDCSGASLDVKDTVDLLNSERFVGLSEMMNVPGVLTGDAEVMQKIEASLKKGLVVDGHAPGLSGEVLKKYVQCGITTDHECTTLEEAREKIESGMFVQIREGSAARNYEALKSLIRDFPEHVMFCTDDSHPGDLLSLGHIDKMVKRAKKDGFDLFDILKIAHLNPVRHYKLNVGSLQAGDSAEFVIFNNLEDFGVLSVYIRGEKKYMKTPIPSFSMGISKEAVSLNCFNRNRINVNEIAKSAEGNITCIKLIEHEIVTEKEIVTIPEKISNFESDLDRDILKIVYLNRYQQKSPQVAYIRGVGLKMGAFASSIAHDSHNIIAVGCRDNDIVKVINSIVENRGGLAVVSGNDELLLPLPIAGIMTDKSGTFVAEQWSLLNHKLKEMGVIADTPFMTLSFMSLVVIPELKIGEKGLFEYNQFDFITD